MEFRRALAWFALLLSASTLGNCGGRLEDPRLKDINTRLSRLEKVPMHFDASNISPQKKELLKALVGATRLIHEAFLHQMYPPGVAMRDSLATLNDDVSTRLHRLVVRNGGPFDKMDEYTNFFASTEKRPLGAAVYAADLTKSEFESYLAAHPREKESLMSPYSVVERDGSWLKAVPYHAVYAEWILPAAELLKKASTLTDNRSFKKYIESRATALLTDNYFDADVDWIDLKESDIDFYIAPYEVYEDHLMGVKAFYEGSVGMVDKEESKRLDVFASHLDELEQNLPYEEKYKRSRKGLVSPMVVLNEIIRGGVVATGYQAVATNLPNDPKVTSIKGTKKVFWKNMMNARVGKVIEPVGRALLSSDQVQFVTMQGAFNLTLMHELCHALGPKYVFGSDNKVSVNQSLKELYPALEEGKATLAGLHSLRYFIDRGIIKKDLEKQHYVSYLAGLFRTIRFGTTEPHSKASMCELNFVRDRGGIRLDPVTKKWSVVFDKIGLAISEMASRLLSFEATGDYEGTKEFFRRWSSMPKEVSEAVKELEHLPVDVEPEYSIQWD
jgi:hypothetical protein